MPTRRHFVQLIGTSATSLSLAPLGWTAVAGNAPAPWTVQVSASGQSHHLLPITKHGNVRLRTALVELAWRLVLELLQLFPRLACRSETTSVALLASFFASIQSPTFSHLPSPALHLIWVS